MTIRYTVTVTDLPAEMAADERMIIDYTADDDATEADIEAQVRMMLPQAARHVFLDGYDPDTASIAVALVG